jgi:hypothetical protein
VATLAVEQANPLEYIVNVRRADPVSTLDFLSRCSFSSPNPTARAHRVHPGFLSAQRTPLGFHSRSPFCARDFVLLEFPVCGGAAPGFVSFGLRFKLAPWPHADFSPPASPCGAGPICRRGWFPRARTPFRSLRSGPLIPAQASSFLLSFGRGSILLFAFSCRWVRIRLRRFLR